MKRWTVARAREWQADQNWTVGCNFLPSSAINQLEMFQTGTFDPATIERELGWAARLGFNAVRVYLHDLLWASDPGGFLARVDRFLAIAAARGLKTLLTLFDDCHRPDPRPGPQPMPVPGAHNSGWMQSPGRRIVLQFHEGTVRAADRERLAEYLRGVLGRFGGDDRVWMWDLYNEPGQGEKGDASFELLQWTWRRAREIPVCQPLTSCLEGSVGARNMALNAAESDVLTFHCYLGAQLEPTILRRRAEAGGRPVVCTEYMARELGTTFQFSLPLFRKYRVDGFNWGLVAGRSQTHFNWKTAADIDERRARGEALQPGAPIPEPPLWFHDIFRTDGSPFDPAETEFIRRILGRGG